MDIPTSIIHHLLVDSSIRQAEFAERLKAAEVVCFFCRGKLGWKRIGKQNLKNKTRMEETITLKTTRGFLIMDLKYCEVFVHVCSRSQFQ